MADEIKIEFGADFKRWLIAKIVLTTLVLGCIGGYLYHKVVSAAEEEKLKEYVRLVGIEGTPILVGVAPDWFQKKAKAGKDFMEDPRDPGLKLTKVMIDGLDLTTTEVAVPQPRSLPPIIGTLNYDNETNFLIKCRFNGELVSFMKVKDKIKDEDNGYDETVVERPVKFGDKVKQGDSLAVFWSVTLGTAKAAFVDAISAVRLSQDAYDRQYKLYKEGGLPYATLKQAERQLQGDNNNLLTAERSLRMWKMSDDEIKALRKEANDIIDALLLVPTGRISRIDDDGSGMTLLLTKDDKTGTEYKFAKDCKFYQSVKKDDKDEKEEIKEGVKAAIFKDLSKKDLGATIVANDKGEATEVLVSKVKERDVHDEVNRWASTHVPVPTFDPAHPDRELTVVEKNTNIADIVDNTNFGTWLFRVADLSKLQIWVHPAEEYLPVIREAMKTYYSITDDALTDLHGVPDKVLAKLGKMKKQKHEKNKFLEELRKQLDQDEFDRYARPIMKQVPLIREGKSTYCTITDDVLKDLRGVPDQVTAKLGQLKKNRKYDQEEFVTELRKLLAAEDFKNYLRPIMKQTQKKGELKWEIRLQSDPFAPPITDPNAGPGDKGLLSVDMICPSLEPNQHNPMVVGYFPNKDHKFLVGQFVTATIKVPPEDNTVEIPTAAINEYNGQSFVFVESPDKDKPGEYFIKRVAVVRRYAEYSIVRSKLRPQEERFSADEVKEGRYPMRPLQRGERVVTHGVVEMTTALESLLTKESIKLQK